MGERSGVPLGVSQRARLFAAPPLPPWAAAAELTIAARPENPRFRESQLTAGEQGYLRALARPRPKGGR